MHLCYIFDSLWHGAICQENKRVALASRVRFGGQKCLDELWRVWNEVLVLPVDGVDRENSIFPDVRMSVFKACPTGRDQRLKEFLITRNLLEKTEGRAADVFVGMLLEHAD